MKKCWAGHWKQLPVAGRIWLSGQGMISGAGLGVKSKVIQQIEWVFTVAPGHPLTQAALPLSQQLIEQHRFVVVRDSSRNHAPQSRRIFSKRPVLSVPSISEKIRALSFGLGVGFLPAHRIRECLEQGVLVALPVEQQIPADSINIAWKTGNKGKVLRWFIDELSESGRLPFA